MLKFSAEQLAALNCKTHEEAAVKLIAALSAEHVSVSDLNALKGELKTANDTVAELKTKLAATEGFSAKISALETATKPEAVKALAREEATLVLGSSGAPTNGSVPANPAGSVVEDKIKTLVADFKAGKAMPADTNWTALAAAINASN